MKCERTAGLPYHGLRYALWSFGLWLAVEYVTVWHGRMVEWVALMPWALIQYAAIVVVFWALFYRLRWSERRVLAAMVAAMYAMELLWRNPMLLSPAWFALASLLLASIWGFLTFVPYWLAEDLIGRRRLPMAFCSLWILIALAMGALSLAR